MSGFRYRKEPAYNLCVGFGSGRMGEHEVWKQTKGTGRKKSCISEKAFIDLPDYYSLYVDNNGRISAKQKCILRRNAYDTIVCTHCRKYFPVYNQKRMHSLR